MPSIRKKLSPSENVNDSKNTRLNIGLALQQMDLRADYLAHMSRYCKIAELMVNESRALKRPLKVFEAGCGELWPLRYLYKAIVIKKSDVIQNYTGFDIEPYREYESAGWFKIFHSLLVQQDLTVNPEFKLTGMDMFITTEVIEHMKKEFVEPWIKDAARCLHAGGLAFISTPNSDGSNEKLPLDHVYEWGYYELEELLRKYFDIQHRFGTFIQLPHFKRAQASLNLWPNNILMNIQERFDQNWQRVILAAPYPQVSNNVTWILRKKNG